MRKPKRKELTCIVAVVALVAVVAGPTCLAYIELAVAYLDWCTGKRASAMKQVNTAIKTSPIGPAYYFRASLYSERSQQKLAARDLTLALEKGWDKFSCFQSRAFCFHATGRLGEATRDYNAALAIKPDSAVYTNLADIQYRFGDVDRAMASCNAALKLDPAGSMALGNRAQCWLGLHEYQKAVDDSSRALESLASSKSKWSTYYRKNILIVRAMATIGSAIIEQQKLIAPEAGAPINHITIWKGKACSSNTV